MTAVEAETLILCLQKMSITNFSISLHGRLRKHKQLLKNFNTTDEIISYNNF
jgi:hypothetical protein